MKPPGNLTGSVHTRFHVNREREEVHVAFRTGHHCRNQHHGVPRADHNGSARLFRQSARLKGDLFVAKNYFCPADSAGHFPFSRLRISQILHFLLMTTSLPLLPSSAGCLPSETQVLDHRPVTLDILLLQIIQKPAPATDHLEQASPGMMIF